MTIYSVTVSIEEAEAAGFLEWMLQTHIPEVLATGCFSGGCRVARLVLPAGEPGQVTYSFQYQAESRAAYEAYRTQHAPGLQAKTAARYGDRLMAFRSLLEGLAHVGQAPTPSLN